MEVRGIVFQASWPFNGGLLWDFTPQKATCKHVAYCSQVAGFRSLRDELAVWAWGEDDCMIQERIVNT